MTIKLRMKIVAVVAFIATVLLLGITDTITLDIGNLGFGGVTILAVGLALGGAIILRFIEVNVDDEDRYVGGDGNDRDGA